MIVEDLNHFPVYLYRVPPLALLVYARGLSISLYIILPFTFSLFDCLSTWKALGSIQQHQT
uniref:Uncharacterized protein n=1 Tax=Triticum urartu TaxID=4572 RepID=A0A8R7UB02_TRIUA